MLARVKQVDSAYKSAVFLLPNKEVGVLCLLAALLSNLVAMALKWSWGLGCGQQGFKRYMFLQTIAQAKSMLVRVYSLAQVMKKLLTIVHFLVVVVKSNGIGAGVGGNPCRLLCTQIRINTCQQAKEQQKRTKLHGVKHIEIL